MQSKNDNIEIMINGEADEVIKELSKSIKKRYQNNFKLLKGSYFVFDYVNLLSYKYHKINPNSGVPYIDSKINKYILSIKKLAFKTLKKRIKTGRNKSSTIK